MIQLQSRLTVADNSEARQVQCIRILSKGKSKTARPGDLITVAVKQARPHKIQKDVCVGMVVRTCKGSGSKQRIQTWIRGQCVHSREFKDR